MHNIQREDKNFRENVDGIRSVSTDKLAVEVQHQVNRLEREVNQLSLVCEALWNLLKEKHGYTDLELASKVMEADMKDGKLDGRNRTIPQSRPCTKCERSISRYNPTCPYCGEVSISSLFG